MTMVLLSDDYRLEQEALLADPVFMTLSNEVLLGVAAADPRLTPEAIGSRFDFTLRIGAEYKARGGTEQRFIGGPTKALAARLRIEATEVLPMVAGWLTEQGDTDHIANLEATIERLTALADWLDR